MPKDPSIRRVLIIGSGPIVIGQACEFDYSGTQACRALREEGVAVVLLNSNPATIMTDPEMAERTYVEPITPETVDRILRLERERGTPVDSILPTLGGQTGLNTAVAAHEAGILSRHGARMIAADCETIRRAEDRELFKKTVMAVGVDVPRSGIAHNMDEAQRVLRDVGLPVVIRPAYTLGGTGGGWARTQQEFDSIAHEGLTASPVSQVLIEEDLTGWKEYELEMMRDRRDNVVVVCSIENLDPMGVHTGDSITVAPALTLTDKEYQRMRDAAIAIMRAVGVECGGSNIQFATDPKTGRMIVIEMNPRVSRSSALASKATGFPIAKIATKLAIGYTLDEIRNDITRETPACFEPVIDYCVVKIPRFAFEKFPEADESLTTAMKSVGEAMAIGRTFKEALQKCIRSMEIKRPGYGLDANDRWFQSLQRRGATAAGDAEVWFDAFGEESSDDAPLLTGSSLSEAPGDWRERASEQWPMSEATLMEKIATPCQGRLYYIRYALKLGWTVERVCEASRIDRWFIDQLKELVDFEQRLLDAAPPEGVPLRLTQEIADAFLEAKALGYSDVQIRTVWRLDADQLKRLKAQLDRPKYKLVDTCAAEFEAYTPYYYSTHERPIGRVVKHPAAVAALREAQRTGRREALMPILAELGVDSPYRFRVLDDQHVLIESHDDELRVTEKPKMIVLGGGPNRIGQGIEFDYCCVHAAMTGREMAVETVMVNSNPETVSTDYDISDLLFFEPLTHEDVLNIAERLNSRPFARVRAATSDARTTNGDQVVGAIVQFGGQTPLNLAAGLFDAGVPILGTPPASIHLAEDRERFQAILRELGLRQPDNGIATSREEAFQVARRIGYPVLVRPSYVLGGRGMQVCNNQDDLARYISEALEATDRDINIDSKHPILVDKFLLDAVEVDVDAIADYRSAADPLALRALDRNDTTSPSKIHNQESDDGRCDICGIMEHIEEAGIHSGDSCCVLPPHSLSPWLIDEIKHQAKLLARRLSVCGLMNVQFAVQGRTVYVLEVNPRASRTIPFVSKATGVPWAKVATRVMLGQSLDEALRAVGNPDVQTPRHFSVKAPVFPFKRFRGVDVVLGPEMRSTGEVMGIDATYPMAFAKALLAAGIKLPLRGRVLVSVNDPDKPRIVPIARELHAMGFEIFSTLKTHQVLAEAGVASTVVSKFADQEHPYLLEMILRRELALLINTPIHTGRASDEGRWRSASIQVGVPLITTLAGAKAAVGAIRAMREKEMDVQALQDYLASNK
ncbi:MAG: carbamoyl-phosphate synthase large subunit [Phycisphaerales bacterium]|nr:carbamoyl-phosphate synthase large subunit [Phycisphaerales bacterium]